MTLRCRSCWEERTPDRLLRVVCNTHAAGDRDCLARDPLYICRPSVDGNRPDCLRYQRDSQGRVKGVAVGGADLFRLELVA